MKVLIVSEFFPPIKGGLEVHVDLLASELQDRGHKVDVATLTRAPTPSHPDVRAHVVAAPVVRRLPHPDPERPYHPPLADPGARRSLARLLANTRPDVVHAHNWLVASLPRSVGAPVVLTVHDSSLICPKQTALRSDGSVCEGPSLARCPGCAATALGWPKSIGLSLSTPLGRRLLHPARVIAVSRSVGLQVGKYLSAPLTVIPNFVPDDLAEQATLPFGLPTGPFVMFAGDPGTHKGIDLLLTAWAAPSPPAAELVLAVTRPLPGPLPVGVRAVSLSRREVVGAFRQAALVVVPSRWPDPLPTVAVEALTVGTPVVASRIGGLPEVVSDGVEGLLFSPGDGAAMRAALERILSEPGLRQRMSTAATVKARAFAASSVVPRIEATYASAIDERGRAASGVMPNYPEPPLSV